MLIRGATTDDREAVIALWQACSLTRPWNDPAADFDRAIDGPTSTVLVAVRDGGEAVAAGGAARRAVVATAMVGYDGHRGWIYYLAVDPAHRRAGLGRDVMAAAEQWLQGIGAVKVELMVRHDNSEATAFYRALGYESADVEVLARWL